MAARIHELRAKRDTLATAANAALDTAQALATAEDRTISAEEHAEQDAFDVKLAAMDADLDLEIRRLARVRGADPEPEATVVTSHIRAEDDPNRGFGSHREFFLSAIENSGLRDRADVSDERLASLAVMDKEDKQAAGELAFMLPSGFGMKATVGSDEQGEYDDTYGGFAVPGSRSSVFLQVGFEGDPTAGMTQDVPMGTPSIEIMARTDKDHSTSVSGGFTVTRRAETSSITASRMGLEMVTLKASSLFGLAYATEELLADSPQSFAALIDSGFRSQMGAHILNEKIRGIGGAEYIGVLNSGCAISITKETNQVADTIVFANINKMAARSWGYGNAVWLANHDCRPQLSQISLPIGTGGVAMYQPSAQVGFPDMLWGKPVIYSEYMPTIGDKGDITLVNWSQYLEGTYQPIQNAESIHVRFVTHERTFKLWTRNAGAPWWRTAMTPNKGATLSPVVTLDAR